MGDAFFHYMEIVFILLPFLALALGVISSIYFLVWWWRHRHERHARAYIHWSLSLFLFYWFQVPAILIGLGRAIIVTDFNLFFALTFPITFLALMFIYLGVVRMSGFKISKSKKTVLAIWFVAATAFFAYQFIWHKGIIQTYILPLGGNIVFYIPMRILIVLTVFRLFFQKDIKKTLLFFGSLGIIGESVLGLARNVFIIVNVLKYPPQAWYTVIAGSKFFFVTQTMSILFLVFGFYFLHRAYHKVRYSTK
ncbi:MAG: hypothetical protein HYT12_02810 [Candidatus Liptonbacteria bacterium]|nr:hypothetical protein [Candidatus Liptonbacteria bacterium]